MSIIFRTDRHTRLPLLGLLSESKRRSNSITFDLGFICFNRLIVFSVNLWLPYEEAWEVKYHAKNHIPVDYSVFKIKGRQIPCQTSTASNYATSSPTTSLSTSDASAIVVENCNLSGSCEEAELKRNSPGTRYNFKHQKDKNKN